MTLVLTTEYIRYEIGRHEENRWLEWNQNLERIAASHVNIVAANNKYDQVRYRHLLQ